MKSIWAQAFVALFLLGNIPVIIRYVEANVYTLALFRLAIGIVIAFLFLKEKRSLFFVFKKHYRFFLLLGFCFFVHWWTYFASIKVSSASIGILGLSSYGVHLLFLSWLIQKEKIQWYNWCTIVLALMGTWFVLPEISWQNSTTKGMALGIVSGFFYACVPILHQRRKFISNEHRTLLQFVVALLFFSFSFPHSNWNLRPIDWLGMLALGVLGTFVAHSLWIRVTTELPARISSPLYYLTIPVTLVSGYFVLGETLNFQSLFGAVLILIANIMSACFKKS